LIQACVLKKRLDAEKQKLIILKIFRN